MSSREKTIDILNQNNIKIEIGGCGCCGSPWVSFEYNGEKIIDKEECFEINMFNDDNNNNDDVP